jgi:hypothetical protein
VVTAHDMIGKRCQHDTGDTGKCCQHEPMARVKWFIPACLESLHCWPTKKYSVVRLV